MFASVSRSRASFAFVVSSSDASTTPEEFFLLVQRRERTESVAVRDLRHRRSSSWRRVPVRPARTFDPPHRIGRHLTHTWAFAASVGWSCVHVLVLRFRRRCPTRSAPRHHGRFLDRAAWASPYNRRQRLRVHQFRGEGLRREFQGGDGMRPARFPRGRAETRAVPAAVAVSRRRRFRVPTRRDSDIRRTNTPLSASRRASSRGDVVFVAGDADGSVGSWPDAGRGRRR